MTVGAAVKMCPVVCISDVINKTGMPGKSVKYVTSRPSPPLLVKNEPNQHEEFRFEAKEKLLFCVTVDRTSKRGVRTETFAYFVRFQVSFVFGSVPVTTTTTTLPPEGRPGMSDATPPPPPSPFLSGIPGLTFDSPYVPLCICMIFLRSFIASVHFYYFISFYFFNFNLVLIFRQYQLASPFALI